MWLGVGQPAFLSGGTPLIGGKGIKIEALTVKIVNVGRVHYALKACLHGFCSLGSFVFSPKLC